MVKMRFPLVFLFVWAVLDSWVNGMPIPILRVPDLLEQAPIVVKGTVESIETPSKKLVVFGLEDHPYTSQGQVRRVQVRVETVIKGPQQEARIPILYFHCEHGPFTILEAGRSYILFLSDSTNGLRLYSPSNGGFLVDSGVVESSGANATNKLGAILTHSLGTRNEVVLETVLQALAQMDSQETVSAIRPFLNHTNNNIRLAAINACLGMGDWDLIPVAVSLYETQTHPKTRRTIGRFGIMSMGRVAEDIVSTLAAFTNKAALPLILEQLGRTANKDMRESLLKDIERMPDAKATPEVAKLIDDPVDEVSYAAYRAICAIMKRPCIGVHVFSGELKRRELEDIRKRLGPPGEVKKDSPSPAPIRP